MVDCSLFAVSVVAVDWPLASEAILLVSLRLSASHLRLSCFDDDDDDECQVNDCFRRKETTDEQPNDGDDGDEQ